MAMEPQSGASRANLKTESRAYYRVRGKYRGCKLSWCGGKHYIGGYCKRHYRQYERTGNPLTRDAQVLQERLEMIEAKMKVIRNQIVVRTGGEPGYKMCLICGALEMGKSEIVHRDECPIA